MASLTDLPDIVGKTVAIRCDAGAHHGLGHLSRGFVVARAFIEAGARPYFVVQAPSNIFALIADNGFESVAVVEQTGQDEISTWLRTNTDLLILDSKEYETEYIRQCQRLVPVLCFDDEVTRDHGSDFILNNNIWSKPQDYPMRKNRELLIGPHYNTVDPKYFSMAGRSRNGVLLSLGGEDPHNHSTLLLQMLAEPLSRMPVHVCIGPAHPAPEKLWWACETYVPHATIHIAPKSLVPMMEVCHIALSAGGTTTYELAAAGIAMAILSVEDHQDILREAFVARGAALDLGSHATISATMVMDTFCDLCNGAIQNSLIEAARCMMPGPGAMQIVRAIAKP